MIVTTTEGVAGHRIVKHCGLAKGCSVRSVHLGEDLMARLKNTVGGEVHEYTQVFAQVREQALDRMIRNAKSLGANAIVGVRFTATEIGTSMAELMAYGTAVVIEEIAE